MRRPGRPGGHAAGRRIRHALLAVLGLLLAGLVVGPATPAAADGLDELCKTVPSPVRPDFTAAGLVMDKPELARVPDRAPDPFADPKVPISDVYGWAWRYTNYDLGCGQDFIRDPNAVTSTNVANIAMAGLATTAATVDSMENMARTAEFEWLKPVVGSIGGTLDERVLTVWLPLALLVVSVVVGLAAVRARYEDTFQRLLVVVGCIVLAVVSLVYPVQAANLMDSGATTVSAAAQGGFGTKASDLLTREALYRTWLVGNFGSADSPVAAEYGPALMSATTYTWSDVKRIQAEPAAQKAIDGAKAAEFRRVAREVERKDPAAYASLTGKTDTRTAATLLGTVWVLIMGFFVAVASLITVLARLIMIGLVIAAMVAAVVGVVRFAVLQRLWDLFTAAVVNIAKFTIAAGVMTLILAAISRAPVGLGWRLLLAVVATVIAVMLTKPVASFKSMAGLDPRSSLVLDSLRRVTGSALGTAAGQGPRRYPGQAAAAEGLAEPGAEPDPVADRQRVELSIAPLPAPPGRAGTPVPRQVPLRGWAGAERFAVDGSRAPRRELAGHGSPGSRPPATERPTAEERPVTWAALPGSPPVREARPVVLEHTRLASALPAEPDAGAADPPAATRTADTVAPPPLTPVRGTVPLRAVPPRGSGAPSRSAVTSAAEPQVVHPTGIWVGAEPSPGPGLPTPGLYRAEQVRQPTEYVRFPEPQLDANGEETWLPTYHAAAAR